MYLECATNVFSRKRLTVQLYWMLCNYKKENHFTLPLSQTRLPFFLDFGLRQGMLGIVVCYRWWLLPGVIDILCSGWERAVLPLSACQSVHPHIFDWFPLWVIISNKSAKLVVLTEIKSKFKHTWMTSQKCWFMLRSHASSFFGLVRI